MIYTYMYIYSIHTRTHTYTYIHDTYIYMIHTYIYIPLISGWPSGHLHGLDHLCLFLQDVPNAQRPGEAQMRRYTGCWDIDIQPVAAPEIVPQEMGFPWDFPGSFHL